MRRFLTLLTFLFSTIFVQAQITINVNGVVVDQNGAGVPNVNIHISTDSTFAFPIYTNTVVTDANGNFSDSFEVPSAQSQGTVFVVMENCPNLPDISATGTWFPGNTDFTFAFIYCDVAPPTCGVSISQDTTGGTTNALTANASGQAPFTYMWSTGELTQTIFPNAPGQYCVTITDSNGCTATDCFTITGGSNCSVFISTNPAGGGLFAVPSGSQPFTYLWSTGETTVSIMPNTTGTFCVTITDDTGCTASDCYFYDPNPGQDSCFVTLDVQGPTGGALTTITANAFGTAPFTYVWSTNETTPTISVSTSGTYCVTVTDADGCIVTACTVVTLADDYQISGFVMIDSLNIPSTFDGLVYLIVHDPVAGTLTAIDTVPFAGTPNGVGWYSFGTVPAGDYLVKAALNPSSPGYADNLPTYYGDVLYWDQATTVTVPNLPSNYNILLTPGMNPGGPGFVGGLISDGANFAGGLEKGGGGDPLPGVSVLLLNEQEEPVTHTATDENGTFGFDNLAWGTYKLVVEIVGKTQGVKWVTIGPDNPSVQVEFNVEDGAVTTSVYTLEDAFPVSLFPNPVQEELTLQMDLEQRQTLQIAVFNLEGKLVQAQDLTLSSGLQTERINVANLSSGIYILQVTGPTGSVSKKLIKQ